MWKLKSVYVENIVSFHEATLNIEQNVATLIFGRNEDNSSQPCNGSGKSSLVEAISFGLTGEQLRKVKTIDEIINDNADNAHVSLYLENDYDNTLFVIHRTISRTAPQVIECHKYDSDGNEIEKDKTVQPTVADYNKFILSEIGLSKDDIYNNYILCDNKYESFFDCSDRNKKEVINRFSNGKIVDESIERVNRDIIPVERELDKANKQVINIKGSISAIENELENVDEKKTKAESERKDRIARIEERIIQCREKITEHEDKLDKAEKRMELLVDLQKQVEEMEKSDIPLLDAYEEIQSMCFLNELGEISDYLNLSDKYKNELAAQQKKVSQLKEDIYVAEEGAKACLESYNASKESYDKQQKTFKELDSDDKYQLNKIDDELDTIDTKLSELEDVIKGAKFHQSELELSINTLKKMIGGAVKCPNCGCRFSLENYKNIDELSNELLEKDNQLEWHKKDLDKYNKEYSDLSKDYINKDGEAKKIEEKIASRKAELNCLYQSVHSMFVKANDADLQVTMMKKELTSSQNELDRINGKIDVLRNRLFGEITGLLEGRIQNGKIYIEQQASSIEFEKGKLTQYKTTKKELKEAPEIDFEASLKQSLVKYQDELKNAEKTAQNIQSEYDKLKGQEINFTMFKSYIARKKIDALSHIVNDFLEKIGSDIRLKLEGFTVTKTGKLRDKISVQVMRDGIDCGSYHKFSGGEKARLNLACILSLHTLTNSNCEDGKGLDFIIIDELLDKSDEVGMATYCDALNKLKQTSLLITQGGISEGYPHKLLITKRQGVSTISK